MLTERILSLGRMARRLGVTQGWLRAEAEAGGVPCLRAGPRDYLFAPEAVEAALAQRATEERQGASDAR